MLEAFRCFLRGHGPRSRQTAALLGRLQKMLRLLDGSGSNIRTHREPIDAVWTWVDGNCDGFLRARNAISTAGVTANGSTRARWESGHEIDFSILSVLRFCPWVRNLYIVVGYGEKPRVSSVLGDRIRYIRHADILPEQSLPTCNSSGIECYLDRIPGLSDRFLYLNDDMFIGRPLSQSDFIDPFGRTKMREEFSAPDVWKTTDPDHAYVSSMANSEMLLDDAFGLAPRRATHHQCRLLSKRGFDEARRRFPEAFAATVETPFRSVENIVPPHLALYCDLYSGHAVLDNELISFVYYLGERGFAHGLERIEKFRPHLFCLNDGEQTSALHRHLATISLCKYYFSNS